MCLSIALGGRFFVLFRFFFIHPPRQAVLTMSAIKFRQQASGQRWLRRQNITGTYLLGGDSVFASARCLLDIDEPRRPDEILVGTRTTGHRRCCSFNKHTMQNGIRKQKLNDFETVLFSFMQIALIDFIRSPITSVFRVSFFPIETRSPPSDVLERYYATEHSTESNVTR